MRPHLTEEMRDAAYRYAERLHRLDGLSREDALEKALALARQGLLTVDGELKPRRRRRRRRAGPPPRR